MIGCEKTKFKTSGIKNLGSNWCFLASNSFSAKNTFAKFEMAFLARNCLLRKFTFWQENFTSIMLPSNESALLLKLLKGLARL